MKNILLISLFSLARFGYSQQDADKIIGRWSSEIKAGRVELYKINNKYFGKMIWFKPPGDSSNKEYLDLNNPDISKRKLPLVGLVFLTDFEYDVHHHKWFGNLYDYDGKDGKTFRSYLQLNQNGTLNLSGYIGRSWMGLKKTTVLTKHIEN